MTKQPWVVFSYSARTREFDIRGTVDAASREQALRVGRAWFGETFTDVRCQSRIRYGSGLAKAWEKFGRNR